MDIKEIVQRLSFEEKARLLTGFGSMETYPVEKEGIQQKFFADGPHGVRHPLDENCTFFPNLCNVGATWDRELVYEMGQAMAEDCIEHNVDMLLGPGINIKRYIGCGRNFEYISEDPIVSGEMGAAYINGLQSKGVAASLKHFAMNNQERHRSITSVEVDERTMREIYLKGFEIAVKKSNPTSVMCSYNKVGSIWCSENKYLLNDILKKEWGYEGFVVSDWGAVQDICKSLCAGLDLQMPSNRAIVESIAEGIKNGEISIDVVDEAVERVLRFVTSQKPKSIGYDRERQHEIARKVAAAGTVLLKNDNDILPITAKKYKKVAVLGEYGMRPLISGLGSAEVHCDKSYIDSPVEELRRALGDEVEVTYLECYKKGAYPEEMVWPKLYDVGMFMRDADVVVLFAGAMESEDTEFFDRRSVSLNPTQEFFLDHAYEFNKNVVVVLQSGSAMIFNDWKHRAPAVVQMWLGGEAAGGAIADVLTGKVNPSGKLTETFPNCMRKDLIYPGDGYKVPYKEGFEVGYRYYDNHPEEIEYPFGHGISYTKFAYSDLDISRRDDKLAIKCNISNIGEVDGAEVVQLYVGKDVSCVSRPQKELKSFQKVFLKARETKTVTLDINVSELAYYNTMLHDWVVEPGDYTFYVGSSSRDIRLKDIIAIEDKPPYTIQGLGTTMIG